MEADAGLVEDVERTDQAAAQGGGNVDALALTTGEGGGEAVERQIAQPHIQQELQPAVDFRQQPFGHLPVCLVEGELVEETVARCGALHVDPSRHTVTVDGSAVALTQKEFEVLRLLLKNKGHVLSRERLLNEVWGYAYTGESRTVDVHIRTLRQKLGDAGGCIETVRGYGYKLRQEGGL